MRYFQQYTSRPIYLLNHEDFSRSKSRILVRFWSFEILTGFIILDKQPTIIESTFQKY